jgi:hypothetical protein
MEQNVENIEHLAGTAGGHKQLPSRLQTELATELPEGQRGLALLLQAAWKASEDSRETLRDILSEIETQGEQSTELLAHVEQRSQDFLEAAEEQSWQTCDRLEQVTIDLGGVSDHLEKQSDLALEQLSAQRKETTRLADTHTGLALRLCEGQSAMESGLEQLVAGQTKATDSLAANQRRLVEQFELSQRNASQELQFLRATLESDRRGRRRQTLVAMTVGVGLLVAGLVFAPQAFFPRPQSSPERSAQRESAPAVKAPRTTPRKDIALPAGMPRSGGD